MMLYMLYITYILYIVICIYIYDGVQEHNKLK